MHKLIEKNVSKSSLYVIIGFFLIFLFYQDMKTPKVNDLALVNNKMLTNVNGQELLDILESKTGVVLVVNDKVDINRILDILINYKTNENISVYNAKYDEVVLGLDDEENVIIKQEPSKIYNKILDELGSYADKYYVYDSWNTPIDTGYLRMYTPMVMFVKDGNILFSSSIVDDSITDEDLNVLYKKGFSLLKVS